jgi:hypothetical protein
MSVRVSRGACDTEVDVTHLLTLESIQLTRKGWNNYRYYDYNGDGNVRAITSKHTSFGIRRGLKLCPQELLSWRRRSD